MSVESTTVVAADLSPRTWRQWWRDLPGYWRIGVRTALVVAGVHVAVAAWMLPGYFESEAVSKVRRHGGRVVYAWQRNPERIRDQRVRQWVDFLKTGYYGQSTGQVRDITLHDVFTDNGILEEIGRDFPNLEWLRINDLNNRVTAKGLMALSGCRKLRGLTIWGHVLDEEFLQSIASLQTLEHLSLMESTVPADDLSALRSLKNLKGLYLNGSDVTDVQLASLAGSTSLEGLDVSGCRLTDESIAVLRQLPSLQYMRLEYTDVTLSSIIQWRNAMTSNRPNIYTDWDLPGTHGVFRWSDGRLTSNQQINLTLQIEGGQIDVNGITRTSRGKILANTTAHFTQNDFDSMTCQAC